MRGFGPARKGGVSMDPDTVKTWVIQIFKGMEKVKEVIFPGLYSDAEIEALADMAFLDGTAYFIF